MIKQRACLDRQLANTGETFFVRLRLVKFEFGGCSASLLELDDLREPLRSMTKKLRKDERRRREAEEVCKLRFVANFAIKFYVGCRKRQKLLLKRLGPLNSPPNAKQLMHRYAKIYLKQKQAQSSC